MTESNNKRIFISIKVSGSNGQPEYLFEEIDNYLLALEPTLNGIPSVQDASTQVYRSQIYASINEYCPNCYNRLSLSHPELDFENGATATANCSSCGWSGTGEYRLIDLLDQSGSSVVSNELVEPSYFPYP